MDAPQLSPGQKVLIRSGGRWLARGLEGYQGSVMRVVPERELAIVWVTGVHALELPLDLLEPLER